jgi:hypothetical protein
MIRRFNSTLINITLGLAVALITTGFLRLQLLTGPPDTDSGFYIFLSQFTYSLLSNGINMPDKMPFALYPLITSWVWALEVQQWIAFRIIDLLVAVIASFLLFKVILKESGSTIFTIALSFPLLLALNSPEYIGYGFKNSIWIAYIPLFSALLLWQNLTKDSHLAFYFIGALAALGVLFREAFLVFFIIGAIAIWVTYGWKTLIRYLIGAAILGFTITGIILYLRNWDAMALISSYTDIQKKTYDISAEAIKKLFYKSGLSSAKDFTLILTTSLITFIYAIKLFINKKISLRRPLFWLSLALVALVEPYIKMGFPYHFAACIPGLAGLSALGWKYVSIEQTSEKYKYLKVAISFISIFFIYPVLSSALKKEPIYSITDAYNLSQSQLFRETKSVKSSNHLIASKIIFENSREDSTLSITGQMEALFPLTGLLPPAYIAADLRNVLSFVDFDETLFKEKIKEYQPTLIMAVEPTIYVFGSLRGEAEISRLIEETNLYEKIAIIPFNSDIHYGWKHGSIYRLKSFN